MEEMLRQILGEVQVLAKRIGSLEHSMTIVKDDISLMKSDIATTKSDITAMKSDMATAKSDITAIKSDMATETQQNENSHFIQALISRTDIIDAKLEGLMVNTASKDAVLKIDAKLNVLNDRLFNQEADIQMLKKAQ